MARTTILLIAIGLLIGGCSSSAERLQKQQSADERACSGYRPGTDAYGNCKLALELQRRNAEVAKAQIQSRDSDALLEYGGRMLRP